MKPIDILYEIINNNGYCEWVTHLPKDADAPCQNCPLSKLRTRSDGSFMGCFSSLIGSEQDYHNINHIYLEAAEKKLLDLQIEELLEQ